MTKPKSECVPSEDSGQPGHLPSMIRVFTVRMKKAWVLSYPLSAQRRLWSDWVDAQADPSLRRAHTHFVGFVMSRLISIENIRLSRKASWRYAPVTECYVRVTIRFLWHDVSHWITATSYDKNVFKKWKKKEKKRFIVCYGVVVAQFYFRFLHNLG